MKPVLLPRSLDELWSCLADVPEAAVYAGGTDLLVWMRSGLAHPPALICLERVDELRGVSEDEDNVRIGACTTHEQLLATSVVRDHLSVLSQAVRHLGSPPVRRMGTIGGNICTASPAGDTLPPLFVLQAEVELRSRDAARRMPLRDFFRAPGQTRLAKGEILLAIWVKKPRGFNIHHFEKVGQRNALAFSLVSLAALLAVSDAAVVERATLAWGSVGPGIVTAPEVERALVGQKLNRNTLEAAAAEVRKAVSPIDDVRGSADYRRTVAGNLLLRLLCYI
jgi:CO/xanthine dehydrogenase FAD-binding subunit